MKRRRRSSGCNAENIMIHSYQRSQFTSIEFITYCDKNGITQSISHAGCPYDNAPMERYYNTLKAELIYISSILIQLPSWITLLPNIHTSGIIKSVLIHMMDI